MIEQLAAIQVTHHRWDRLVGAVEVTEFERRQPRQVCGAVGALLALLERARVCDDALQLVGRHGSFGGVQFLALRIGEPLIVRRVGFGDDGQAVRVGEQVGADQAAQEAGIGCQAALDDRQRQFVAQRLQRVAAIVPVLQCTHEKA